MESIKSLEAVWDNVSRNHRYILTYKNGVEKIYKGPESYIKNLDENYEIICKYDDNNNCIFKDEYDCLGLVLCKYRDNSNIYNTSIFPYMVVREDRTSEIINTEEFINGYKLVRFKNGEYGYIREIDNYLMPYRFDIATSFNSLNMALVGKNFKINYIDKDFLIYEYNNYDEDNYIEFWNNYNNDFFTEDTFPLKKNDCKDNMKGFNIMSYFIEGDSPFTIIGERYKDRSYAVDIDGDIVRFNNYYDGRVEEVIPSNFNNIEFIDNSIIVLRDNDIDNPIIYLPYNIYFNYDDIIKFVSSYNIEYNKDNNNLDRVREILSNSKFMDTVKYKMKIR